MSGIWSRLVGRDREKAKKIAERWIGHNRLLLRRLGYWGASVYGGELVEEASKTLNGISRDEFWSGEHNAETALFLCKQWNKLPKKTKGIIETLILRGPDPKKIRSDLKPKEKRDLISRLRYRELLRIASAGGKLSPKAKKALKEIKSKNKKLPKKIAIYEGYINISYSGAGEPSDTSKVASIPPNRLLGEVKKIQKAEWINQSGLWAAVCRNRPHDALSALLLEGKSKKWPTDKWQDFLNAMSSEFRNNKIDKFVIAQVAQAITDMPDAAIHNILNPASYFINSVANVTADKDIRPLILIIWDRLFEIIQKSPETKDGTKNIAEESLGHPIGQLAEVLIYLQDKSDKAKGAGLTTDLEGRFESLANLSGHIGLLAYAQLVRPLMFFNWLAPKWAEKRLFTKLDSDGDEARKLLGVTALYGRYQSVDIFNRLKPRICAVLLDEKTSEDVREHLASFVTSIMFQKIYGKSSANITEPEARSLLTRSPAKALRSIAWSIWRTMHDEKPGKREERWKKHIEPFLRSVWPNDVATRNEQVSEMLIKIPASTGNSLPSAVRLILSLAVPIKSHTMMHGLDVSDQPDVIKSFPKDLLELANNAMDVASNPPYDLQEFLDKIAEAEPKLKSDARYLKLENALRKTAA